MNRELRRDGLAHDEPVYQISIVARMVGLHQQTIRSYERVGLVQPARTSGNTRLYSQRDVERLQQVVRLVNDLGINLAGVEVILRLRAQIEALSAELEETRRELEALRASAGNGRARQSDNKNPDMGGGNGR